MIGLGSDKNNWMDFFTKKFGTLGLDLDPPTHSLGKVPNKYVFFLTPSLIKFSIQCIVRKDITCKQGQRLPGYTLQDGIFAKSLHSINWFFQCFLYIISIRAFDNTIASCHMKNMVKRKKTVLNSWFDCINTIYKSFLIRNENAALKLFELST